MALKTFSPGVSFGVAGPVKVYTTKTCIRAASVQVTGRAVTWLTVSTASGIPPTFKITAVTTVYFRRPDGTLLKMTTPSTVTVENQAGTALPNIGLHPRGI